MVFGNLSARRSTALAVLVLAGVCFAPLTANAAGFFDQLFGAPAGAPAEVSSSSQGYEVVPDHGAPSQRHHARRIVKQDAAPVLQKTTDLMHDKTLRAGDPVMMKDGIHIYSGPETGRHSTKQFVALDAAQVSPKTRNALVAMDMTRRDTVNDVPVQEGRSASINSSTNGSTVSAGYPITDASGKSVRYVGP